MSRLRDDIFTKRGVSRLRRPSLSALVFVLMFAALALLVLSRFEHSYVVAVRHRLEPVFTPVLTALSVPLAPVRLAVSRLSRWAEQQADVEQLKSEIQRLKGWEWRAGELERQLAVLGRLAKVVEEAKLGYLTARVIGDSTGPFVRAVLIDAGSDKALKVGQPVISADGLVGRIVEVGERASRVLLLSDINSRIPVHIGAAMARGIAVGDNGGLLRLDFLPRDAGISVGDIVATSGVGGLFPRALRLGTVVASGEHMLVQPFAVLDRLEFVSVLLYENPAIDLAHALASRGMAPPRSAIEAAGKGGGGDGVR